jgi:hypothetical protein
MKIPIGFRTKRKERNMSVLDDILQAVADSQKLDAGVKTVVAEFLEAARPALETLAPAVLRDVLSKFAAGDGATGAASVAETLSADQVDSTLGALEQQMQSEVDRRAAQVEAARETMAALQNAAISVLARLLVSAL